MKYNGSENEKDMFSYIEGLANQFLEVHTFGDTEEDVSAHSNPAYLPDEPSADVVAYIRSGTPYLVASDRLLAVAIWLEEEASKQPQ